MSELMKFWLVVHVVLGVLGVAAFYLAWMWLLKERPNASGLRKASLKGTIFLILSWLAGGYYYAAYYGGAVKSAIKAGPNPWAHAVFMEAKEHIFLFLPFLAVVLTVVIFSSGEDLSENRALKSAAAALAGTLAILGIIITLAGTVVSGSVR